MIDDKSSRGRNADSPWRMPFSAWKDVVFRTYKEASADNAGLVAAGVAFYSFLALVPLLGATVLSYGLLAGPATVVRHMEALTTVLPSDIARLIGEQLLSVVEASGEKKGLGLLAALAVALFGARNAAGAIVTALNIAYEETEKRGFIKVNALALAMTVAAVGALVIAMMAIASLGYVERLLPTSNPVSVAAGKVATYLVLMLAAAAAATMLYRYGPSRNKAQWTWLTPGSMLFALAWVSLTLGFGIYVANFGNYGATYGSLGAVVVLLTWFYLTAYALIFGAELNSQLELQTAQDTTRGPDRPLGQRGAWVADHVGSENGAPRE